MAKNKYMFAYTHRWQSKTNFEKKKNSHYCNTMHTLVQEQWRHTERILKDFSYNSCLLLFQVAWTSITSFITELFAYAKQNTGFNFSTILSFYYGIIINHQSLAEQL